MNLNVMCIIIVCEILDINSVLLDQIVLLILFLR